MSPQPTNDWYQFWNNSPDKGDDFLRQVGKTVGGKPISAEQVQALVLDIVARLQLNVSDDVLDLCCGNGFVTNRCSAFCRSLVGVDYSAPLIEVATTRLARENVRYLASNVCELPEDIFSQRL